MSAYPLRYRLLLGIALCHLALVALGASNIGYSWSGRARHALNFYGSLSGAGDSYGFFAPGVFGQLRAFFDVVDARGASRTVLLETGASHEADLRVGNIIDQFSEGILEPEERQRSLSASLAGTVFGRYPEARKVVVHLEHFSAVSMAEYRQGVRPRWEPVYRASYVLNRIQEAR